MSVCRDRDFSIYHHDTTVKKWMKKHADIRTHSKPCKIQIGDTVLVRQDKHNKLSAPFGAKSVCCDQKERFHDYCKKLF